MRVGILVECGRGGLEDVVVRRICELLKVKTDIVTMDNKARLILECGPAVAGLLKNGCDRVVVLWDERPAWPKHGEKLCWHNDRQDILASLAKAKVKPNAVSLVCIEREFESWLLFDEQMLSCVLSRTAHPAKAKAPRNPDRHDNPKGAMMRLFEKHGRGRYNDLQFAQRFARCLTALNRLRRCQTFQRFEDCLTRAH